MRVIVALLLVWCLAGYGGIVSLWGQEGQGDELKVGDKPTLAVLPLDATGVSLSEARELTNQLVVELVQTNRFIVIEQAKVDELLKEQGLGQAGCLTAECLARAGKMLGAQLMVAGSVGKIGRTYNVTARIVDVETRRLLKTTSTKHRGEIDGLLDKMRDIALQLAETREPPSPPPRFQLQISPNPADATVYIDDQRIGQGMVTRRLPSGQHKVRVTRKNFQDWEQTIDLDQDQSVTPNLTRIKKGGRGLRKVILGLLGGGGVGTAVYFFFIKGDGDKGDIGISGSPPDPPPEP